MSKKNKIVTGIQMCFWWTDWEMKSWSCNLVTHALVVSQTLLDWQTASNSFGQ